jgi:hypothetical protein
MRTPQLFQKIQSTLMNHGEGIPPLRNAYMKVKLSLYLTN